jgi:membrane protease YdiL (CAAX protease family)
MSGGRDGSTWFVASSGRLRAPWRLSVFGVAFIVAWVLANAMVYPLLSLLTAWIGAPLPFYTWLMLVAAVAAHGVALRQVDDLPWEAVGVGVAAWRRGALAVGAAAGAAAIAATLLLLLVTGGLRAERLGDGSAVAWAQNALHVLWLLAPAALWEELVFRGYLWRVAQDAGGVRVALVATSVGFGAVHLLNPGAGPRTLSAVVLAGACLGLVRVATDSVAAAWAAHLAWNWVMAAVAHVPVSGLPFGTPGWRLVPVEPAWWSGGGWGPEGGGAAILVFTMAFFMGWRRGWLTPPAEPVGPPAVLGTRSTIIRGTRPRSAPSPRS